MSETRAPPRAVSAHTHLLLDAYARMTTTEKNPSGIWRRNEDAEIRRLRRLLDAQGCLWVPSIQESNDDGYHQQEQQLDAA
jgi:hypothetical protein